MNKKHLIILGGGHAGSSAALAAANHINQLEKDDEIHITLIDQSNYLTIRPRLYEYELEQTRVPLKSFLQPIGVSVLKAQITDIDFNLQQVHYQLDCGTEESANYDALVLALGSQLSHPNISGIHTTYNIDRFDAAMTFRRALIQALTSGQQNCRVAILGGGITGLELATELPVTAKKTAREYQTEQPKLEIFLLDRNKISKNFGSHVESEIARALQTAHINCLNQVNINAIGNNWVQYNHSETLEVDLIVSTLGLCANQVTEQFSLPKDQQGRIDVNKYLQLSKFPNCFAAGDIAFAKPDNIHAPVMSCQQGRPQGRYAGFNAASILNDQALIAYSQPNYVTCIDLGEFGGHLHGRLGQKACQIWYGSKMHQAAY